VKAFQEGMDGVLIAGCHIGDCHYLKGNYMTAKRFLVLREALKFLGLEERRLRLEWISAAEGEKYAEVVRSFTEQVKALGPSPLRRKPVRRGREAGERAERRAAW
ncbi:MAG: hydrogenase iron-sulfur subunit, partial [Actinomycetota bacterium]|nr:hydrogenase iron-sulfur subunit [Actinomycetota bacterium]